MSDIEVFVKSSLGPILSEFIHVRAKRKNGAVTVFITFPHELAIRDGESPENRAQINAECGWPKGVDRAICSCVFLPSDTEKTRSERVNGMLFDMMEGLRQCWKEFQLLKQNGEKEFK